MSFLLDALVSCRTVSRMGFHFLPAEFRRHELLEHGDFCFLLVGQLLTPGGAELLRGILALLDLLADCSQFLRFVQFRAQATLGDGCVRHGRFEGAQRIESDAILGFHGGFHAVHDLV